jgi:hypothetical protein
MLAAHFFSAAEQAALAGAGPDAAVGLAGRLDVLLDTDWRIASVDAGPGYAAAVAAAGQGWRVILADWDREAVSAR